MGRKAIWAPVPDERGLPKLRPIYGPRPLDAYTSEVVHERDSRGKPTGRAKVRAVSGSCPCNGAIPYGSPLVCEVCGRSGLDDKLNALRLKSRPKRDDELESEDDETEPGSPDGP